MVHAHLHQHIIPFTLDFFYQQRHHLIYASGILMTALMRQNMTKAHKYVVLGQGYTCGGKWAAVEVSELIVTELIKT